MTYIENKYYDKREERTISESEKNVFILKAKIILKKKIAINKNTSYIQITVFYHLIFSFSNGL